MCGGHELFFHFLFSYPVEQTMSASWLPAPLIPPFRFGTVEPEVYRGAYPKQRNLRYLKRYIAPPLCTFLRLRTMPCCHLARKKGSNFCINETGETKITYCCHVVLDRLKLKTILSLVPDEPDEVFQEFCREQRIRPIHLSVDKVKDNVPLTYNRAVEAVQVCGRLKPTCQYFGSWFNSGIFYRCVVFCKLSDSILTMILFCL